MKRYLFKFCAASLDLLETWRGQRTRRNPNKYHKSPPVIFLAFPIF